MPPSHPHGRDRHALVILQPVIVAILFLGFFLVICCCCCCCGSEVDPCGFLSCPPPFQPVEYLSAAHHKRNAAGDVQEPTVIHHGSPHDGVPRLRPLLLVRVA